MARMNSVFAQNQVNVEGQALGTRGEVGYVITEIAGTHNDEMFERLTNLEGTIRTRRL